MAPPPVLSITCKLIPFQPSCGINQLGPLEKAIENIRIAEQQQKKEKNSLWKTSAYTRCTTEIGHAHPQWLFFRVLKDGQLLLRIWEKLIYNKYAEPQEWLTNDDAEMAQNARSAQFSRKCFFFCCFLLLVFFSPLSTFWKWTVYHVIKPSTHTHFKC